jgi:Ca2+-binding RTX toxin-like protein
VNRYLSTMLVAAAMAAAVLPQAVSAQDAAVGGLAGGVNLAVADVTTGGVAISSPTTSTLTATVDPNSVGTQYYFEYGTNGNLTLRTQTVDLGGSLDPRQVTAELLGLEPGTLYDYRIVAAGPGGLSVGPTLSFQTGALATSPKKGSRSSCTIRGTSKSDVLRGTRKRDVICGLGGNDRITGLGGNDLIVGGAGSDRVKAGGGRDQVKAGAGRDRVWGNAGNDALYGQSGADRLYGGKGRDRIVGGAGHDSAHIDRRDTVRSVEKASRR